MFNHKLLICKNYFYNANFISAKLKCSFRFTIIVKISSRLAAVSVTLLLGHNIHKLGNMKYCNLNLK